MASFTGVGDNVVLSVTNANEKVDVAISGTYDMSIDLQREVSPGGGAWEHMKTWDTANATVAYSFTTDRPKQRYRLIVQVDTSGTATATLTNTAKEETGVLKDENGAEVAKFYEGGLFAPVRTPVLLDAAVTLERSKHAFRPLLHTAAAGYDITMPAATGSGDVYEIHVCTIVASTDLVIQAGSAADEFNGAVTVSTDIAGVTCPATDADDTLTMNGSTTGGLVGSWVRLVDVQSGVWHVHGHLVSSGAEADPWGALVS